MELKDDGYPHTRGAGATDIADGAPFCADAAIILLQEATDYYRRGRHEFLQSAMPGLSRHDRHDPQTWPHETRDLQEDYR